MNPTPQKSPVSAVDAPWLNWLPKIAGTLALFLVIGYAFTFRELSANANPAAWGAFGDYMGGLLNPLISLFTLIVAMKVWGLQKTELLETRKAVEEQGKTAEQQRREQRFFDFLNIYRSTVDSIEFEIPNKSGAPIAFKGKRAFKYLTGGHPSNPFKYIAELFQIGDWEAPYAKPTDDIAQSHWDKNSPVIDHYFRIVFTLLREAEPTLKDDCWRYMKLLRAQFSRDEINLLAMNLLFDGEGKKMRSLVERYGMLKHMPANHLRKIAEKELDPRSFGRKWTEERLLTPCEEPHAD